MSSPCRVKWESLTGDDRIRYCGQCRLNVYNLTVMSPVEVEGLVRAFNGRLCGRLYVRPDRTATVQDCRSGRGRKWIRSAWTVGAFALIGGLSWFLRGIEGPDRSVHHPWVRQVLEWISPEPRVRMGKMAPPLPPPPTQSP